MLNFETAHFLLKPVFLSYGSRISLLCHIHSCWDKTTLISSHTWKHFISYRLMHQVMRQNLWGLKRGILVTIVLLYMLFTPERFLWCILAVAYIVNISIGRSCWKNCNDMWLYGEMGLINYQNENAFKTDGCMLPNWEVFSYIMNNWLNEGKTHFCVGIFFFKIETRKGNVKWRWEVHWEDISYVNCDYGGDYFWRFLFIFHPVFIM